MSQFAVFYVLSCRKLIKVYTETVFQTSKIIYGELRDCTEKRFSLLYPSFYADSVNNLYHWKRLCKLITFFLRRAGTFWERQ